MLNEDKESLFLQLIDAFEGNDVARVKELVPSKLQINEKLTKNLVNQVNLEFNRKFKEVSINLLCILYDAHNCISYLLQFHKASSRLIRIATEFNRFLCLKNIISSQKIDTNTKDRKGITLLVESLSSTKEVFDLISSIEGLDINERSIEGSTAAMIAAKNGQIDYFRILCEKGADLNILNDFGENVVHLAVASSNPDMLKEVIKHDVDTTLVDKRGLTPLQFAVRTKNFMCSVILTSLMKNDINTCDKIGITPLQQSVINRTHDITEFLLKSTVLDINKRDTKGNTALHYACKNDDEISAAFIASHEQADLNAKNDEGKTPFEVAFEQKAFRAGCALLVYDEVEASGISVFSFFTYYFIKADNGEGLRSLLRRGADFETITINGTHPLIIAASLGKVEAVRTILSTKNVEINARRKNHNETALHIACTNANYPFVITRLLLLNPMIDVNAKDDSGNTPLFMAIFKKCNSSAELLIDHPDTDINPVNNAGVTPIMIAAMKGNAEIGMKLIETGKCDLERLDKNEMTPLMLAVSRGSLKMVKILIEYGKVDVFRQTEAGTCFSIALKTENEEIIKYLIKIRAYDTTLTENGKSVFDLVREMKNKKLMENILDLL